MASRSVNDVCIQTSYQQLLCDSPFLIGVNAIACTNCAARSCTLSGLPVQALSSTACLMLVACCGICICGRSCMCAWAVCRCMCASTRVLFFCYLDCVLCSASRSRIDFFLHTVPFICDSLTIFVLRQIRMN